MNDDRCYTQQRIPEPPPITRAWVRVVLGAGVGVGVGLAPWLGKVGVPGFASLLEIFPEVLKVKAVPIATFVLGVEGAAVQFWAHDALPARTIRRWFGRTLAATALSVLALVLLHSETVAIVPFAGRTTHEAYTIGSGTRPVRCNAICPPEISDSQCIYDLGGRPSDIESCWGSARVRRSNTWLLLSYLFAMLGFGAVAGLIVLQSASRARKKRESQRPRA